MLVTVLVSESFVFAGCPIQWHSGPVGGGGGGRGSLRPTGNWLC